MTDKEKLDAILQELYAVYGGDRTRLASLQRMTYMQRHLDYDFMIKQCKIIYKKSATKLLTEMGILSVPYKIDDALLDPVKHKCTFEGNPITITYKPRAVMNFLITDIYHILNNGNPYNDYGATVGRKGGKGPQMYTPESVAEHLDNTQENKPINVDKEDGVQKLKAFSDLCVALTNPEKLEELLPHAERKKDGSLAKKKTIIAWTGVTIQYDVLMVYLKLVDESNFEVKIKRENCNERIYKSLIDKPVAIDIIENYK